jgi:hypothetical protein
MINKIAKEYDSSRNRRSYLIALKFVAGDDFKKMRNARNKLLGVA